MRTHTARRSARAIREEKGIALVIALFLTLAMSAIGASMMFLSQTETYSSMNYRMMSQARYGAESGIQTASNYFMYSYTPPATASGTDPLSNYTWNATSPVLYNGKPVVLSSVAGASNYPIASVVTAFTTAAGGSFQNGNVTVAYAPTATLISMQEIPAAQALGGVAFTIQTWQIVSDGTISAGSRNAKVEVKATYDTQLTSTTGGSSTTSVLMPYAAFAAAATCGAIQLSGGATTNAYTYSSGFTYTYSGNVGTNGNMQDSGGATIDGTLSTPRSGVGSCTAGNVDGLTSSGGAEICPTSSTCSTTGANGGLVHLSSPVTYTPIPAGTTGTGSAISVSGGATSSYTDTSLGLTAGTLLNYGNVSLSGGGTLTLGPGSYGNISGSGGGKLHLQAGTYNINSISESGGVNLYIDSGPVILNVAGTGVSTPISLSGGAMCCYNGGSSATTTYDSSQLQIEYAGTGTISLSGGTAQNAVIYAPNAAASLSGGTNFYGAMVVGTITDSGGAALHYDKDLSSKTLFQETTTGGQTLYQTGNSMLSAFSWTTF